MPLFRLQRLIKFSSIWLLLGVAPVCMAAKYDVAYLAYTDNYWQVWLTDQDAKNHIQLTRSAYDKNRISWYPDGNSLLVNGIQGELAKVSIKSGDEIKLPFLDRSVIDAVISPNGQYIAYSQSTGASIDQNNIWVYDLKKKTKIKLTNNQIMQNDPVWSLDSKQLYYLAGQDTYTLDLWSVTLKEKTISKLTFDKLYHLDVAVNKNNELLFSSNRDGNYEIYRTGTSTKPKRETNHPALDGKPSWGHGKVIYFESSRTKGILNIWKKNIRTGILTQLTNHKQGARNPIVYLGGVQ